MKTLEPHDPGFRTIKQLVSRMEESDESGRISVDEAEVPAWQRQLVWSEGEMGLLALSILRSFPIGMIILWRKPGGIRVPIDGRQRLTAIQWFVEGRIAIPDIPAIPLEYRNLKYRLLPGDKEAGYTALPLRDREDFDGYEIHISQYDDIPEKVAMSIFVMLQGGKSLTKTEIRSALGGKVAGLVSRLAPVNASARHVFFQALTANLHNRRKSHRNVCDILLHEYLYPGHDKHWTSLEEMYREKSDLLTGSEEKGFSDELTRFYKSMQVTVRGKKVLLPQLRSAFFILTVFRAWRELMATYDIPKDVSLVEGIAAFETERAAHPDKLPWIVFTNELSNAGYARNRIESRHDILCSYLLERYPTLKPKERDRRAFTLEQKLAIWNRAGHRCEWVDEGDRCAQEFPDPRKADADHVAMWSKNGPTTVANGRLLCPKHNRARKS